MGLNMELGTVIAQILYIITSGANADEHRPQRIHFKTQIPVVQYIRHKKEFNAAVSAHRIIGCDISRSNLRFPAIKPDIQCVASMQKSDLHVRRIRVLFIFPGILIDIQYPGFLPLWVRKSIYTF